MAREAREVAYDVYGGAVIGRGGSGYVDFAMARCWR
jgi:hypothetical protein